jgi:hypothetical protein
MKRMCKSVVPRLTHASSRREQAEYEIGEDEDGENRRRHDQAAKDAGRAIAKKPQFNAPQFIGP